MILRCLLLALLCVITYAPTLSIPLLEDDYPNIGLAQTLGSFSDLPRLFDDAVLRPRATTWWSTLLLWRNFYLNPVPYHVFALIFHIANTLMLYRLAMLWPSMRSGALPAAAFFAVHEGHQEAVMWLSGMTEVFLFFFGIAALLCWMQSEKSRHGWLWRAAALILFAFTLLSKESGVILLPFFVLTAPLPPSRSSILRLLPLFALAAVAVIATFATQSYSFRFTTFSLHAPFWITWPRSFGRLLWVWGWLALGVIFWQKRDRDLKKSALLALVWIGIAFAPYSFLAHPYSTQIASRQTYLASAGLALLFGLAFAFVSRNTPRPRAVVPAILGLMLIYNVGWIWTKKRAQFLERAAPTEELIDLARRTNGPIWMRCFPRQEVIAEEAVRLGAGRPANTLVWTEAEATSRGATAVFCHPDR